MSLFSARDRRAAEMIAAIGYTNPFLTERVELERRLLGRRFVEYRPVLHLPPGTDPRQVFPNVDRLQHTAESLADAARTRLAADEPDGSSAVAADLALYEDLVLYLLYMRYLSNFDGLAVRHFAGDVAGRASVWRQFLGDHRHYFRLPGRDFPLRWDAAHAFAVLFQIQRAFAAVFENIVGRSMPVARLRAAAWESIFTRDMSRYARAAYRGMRDVSTLILGPSGTGKELVARAIGFSQFMPFDAKSESFRAEPGDALLPLNVAALSPTLVESELFGHKKGAFTGAVADRRGWLEGCGEYGTVFLDEVGELDSAVQVKLLRVLQSRTFQRVGDTVDRTFRGKFVAATNRDLAAGMRDGTFREDFYYRLCADVIRTPSLREQFSDAPEDLAPLVRHVARRVLPDAPEQADQLADEAANWIERRLGLDYAWPGNFRELEQCVRNILVHGSYEPPLATVGNVMEPPLSARARFASAVADASLTLAELTSRYVSLAYALEGTYDAAGRRLGVDWRTVREKTRDADVLKFVAETPLAPRSAQGR